MTTRLKPSDTSRRRPCNPLLAIAGIVGIVLVTGVVSVGLLVAGVAGHLGVKGDAGALRDSLMESSAGDWERKIEVNVGAFALNLARAAIAFVDLDPEVRDALRAVRGAEAGVYERRGGVKGRVDRAAMLQAADKAMAARGWDRLVGVVDGDQLVAVYLPAEIRSPRDVKVCIGVLDEEHLVVAGGRSNVEPLVELAVRRAEWRQGFRTPVRF
ncbi:MAG TPA: hypothetical protein VJW76_16790 [Verrucomicrobiae bacterium]|nr:hypothetical protein [Verrucomicrobiae bacterium]